MFVSDEWFDCSESEGHVNDSKLALQINYPFVWVECVVAFIGIVKNAMVLIAFIRLKWLMKSEKILFTNVSATIIISCICLLVVNTVQLKQISEEQSDIENETLCVGKWSLFNFAVTSSDGLGMFIALDRFLARWYPMQWRDRIGQRFRWIGVSIAYAYGISSQTGFLLTSEPNSCVLTCALFNSKPLNSKHSTLVFEVGNLLYLQYIMHAFMACEP